MQVSGRVKNPHPMPFIHHSMVLEEPLPRPHSSFPTPYRAMSSIWLRLLR
jgi:hypothetical protein